MARDRPLLTTTEAARRLGVKPETLYAYVSRGLVTRTRGTDGRTSLFDPAEVDALVGRPRAPLTPRVTPLVPLIRTRLTSIDEGRLVYRGRDAAELAGVERFEAVARWLWSGTADASPFRAPPAAVAAARVAAGALPPGARTVDRIRTAVVAAGAADPLRGDLRPEAVALTAASLLAAVVDGLPRVVDPGAPPAADRDTGPGGTEPDGTEPDVSAERPDRSGSHLEGAGGEGTLAARLWPALTASPPRPTALDAALTLLADHELTAPTLAARVAASTRAHPYAVVAAGLAAVDGPLHGSATAAAHRALVEAAQEGSGAVLARLFAEGRSLPGHHPLHPDGDPRGRRLFELVAADPPDARRWAVVEDFLAVGRRGTHRPPTVDFALAALTYTAGMDAGAGEAVFALARSAGWIAHALEEYAEDPQRFRPATTYLGPPPA